MTPTPVGMRCPECAKQKTQVRTAATIRGGGTTQVTVVLIVINVIAALASGSLGLEASNSTVMQRGELFGPALPLDHEYYRLVTSGFLHAGIIHLGFNMYLLWVLGQMLEPALGSVRFALLYAASLLAGSLGVMILSWDKAAVGASGAVFGLMGVAFFEMRARGIDPMASGIGPLILLNLVITFAIPNIAIGAHIGGLVGGSLAALAIQQVDRRRLGNLAAYAVLVAIAIAAAGGAIAVADSECDANTLCSQIKSAS